MYRGTGISSRVVRMITIGDKERKVVGPVIDPHCEGVVLGCGMCGRHVTGHADLVQVQFQVKEVEKWAG